MHNGPLTYLKFLAQIIFTSLHFLCILKRIEVYTVHNAIFRALDILTKILPTNTVQCIQTRTCLPRHPPATQFFFSYIYIQTTKDFNALSAACLKFCLRKKLQ